MLFVNNEPIKIGSPQKNRFDYWKENTLSKMKNPVVFKSGLPIKINATGLAEPPKNEMIPYRATITGKEGDSETWIYSPVLPIKRKDEYVFTERRMIFKHGRKLKLDKGKDTELIFFLTEISPFVKKGRIVMEDKELEARKEIEKIIGSGDVQYHVYSKYSPISPEQTRGEETLRLLASAWGVPYVEDMGINEVRVALVKAVEESQGNYAATKRGYNEFLAETKINDLLVLRANVQKAIDKGVIFFDEDNISWKFKTSGYTIMNVSHRDLAYKEAALYNHIRVRQDLLERFNAEVSGGYVAPSEEVLPEIPDDLENIPYIDLQRIAPKYGIKTFGVNKEKLIFQLSEKKKELVP